ncbi:MAG: hypothetical protein H7338_02990, partial [Candidatus Sericytochromatia bacterium]|nr:hypothetical protein [Candidatus Sericytochromatia bacterium]
PAATGAPFTPLLGRHPSSPTQTYEDRMFNAEARDFVLAKLDFKEGLRFSKYGNTVFEASPSAGKVTLLEQGTGGVGRVQLYKLEGSNVNFDTIAGEMKMAEHMYDGLANVLEVRYSMIDTMFHYLIP